MNELHKSKAFLWTVFAIFALAWLWVLGYRTLVPPDDSRYADSGWWRAMPAASWWPTAAS